VNLMVDTSVWSLALRRDVASDDPTVERLEAALTSGEGVFTTGLVLQELLQGFGGPRARDAIVARFEPLPLLMPDRADHVRAAERRNTCHRHGVQIGTVDALLAQLCLRHELTMLSTDRDFARMVEHTGLQVWSP
jgi:predicted nucleic acid-binding protein